MTLRFVKSKLAMANLFDDLAGRYADRPGGYCRIIKLATTRAGDASDMAIVQLIGSERDVLTDLKEAKKKPKPAKKKSSKTLEKVSTEIKADEKPKAEVATEETPTEAVPEVAEEKAEAVAPAAVPAPEVASAEDIPAEDAKADTKATESKS